ncbi:variant SH3 domain-containing protein [Ditylenchus destructor]|uniref:Variant SH3 domain-containing protein n=1 Tax=Ditylenchus destructor TaxID=166010 RepID=A0AAD4RAR5_9BILA|nr:variant SH3 domain-containing protein [Ditylenchus destructor]
MTCNLLNHEKELRNAFNAVSNSTNGDQWCIFEYDGNSNIIRLGSSGESGGLAELVSNLNSGKIQYGFATTTAANFVQRKVVLIHWQGEGVPAARLANTAAHAEEVRRFVRLVHLTIYARNEEDVDLSAISKHRKSSASSNVSTPWVPPAPVGTDYCPTKATRDIDMDERTRFWNEMRTEEEERRREEARRKEEQQSIFATERRQLENKLHEQLTAVQAAKQPQLTKTQSPKTFKFQVGVVNPAASGQVPVNRISSSEQQTDDTPTVIECTFNDRLRHGINGSSQNIPSAPKSSELPKTVISAIGQPPVHSQPMVPCVVPMVPTGIVQPVAREEIPMEEPTELKKPNLDNTPNQQYEEPPSDIIQPPLAQNAPTAINGQSVRAKALWDYQAEDDSEISFDPDDIITDIEMIHEGWWRGRNTHGLVGLFPSNYVEFI